MDLDNWVPFKSEFYKPSLRYAMNWNLETEMKNVLFAISPNKYLIAKLVNPDALSNNSGSFDILVDRQITINTLSGRLLRRYEWDFSRKLAYFTWTDDDTVTTICKNGEIDVFSANDDKPTFPPPMFGISPSVNNEIIACEFNEKMLIVLTAENKFYCLRNFPNCNSFVPEPILIVPKQYEINCFTIIPPLHSYSGFSDIYCGCSNGGIVIIEEMKYIKFLAKFPTSFDKIGNSIKFIKSSSGKKLVLILENLEVFQIHSNFSDSAIKIEIENKSKFKHLFWIGDETIGLTYSNRIILQNWDKKYSIPFPNSQEGVFCFSFNDEIRILTGDLFMSWEKVGSVLYHSLSKKQTHPPTLLYSAYEKREIDKFESDKIISHLINTDEVADAIEFLLQFACSEVNAGIQDKLLKAVLYGKNFLSSGVFNEERFNAISERLKLINKFNDETVAIPVTYKRLNYMQTNSDEFIKKLVYSNYHLLALELAKVWKARPERIFEEWACSKLQNLAFDDDDMYEILYSKLKLCPSVSYINIARSSYDCGRKGLAKRFVNNEKKLARKIPMLIYINEILQALDLSIESKDPDLIYQVLFKIHEIINKAKSDPELAENSENLFNAVLSKPVSKDLFLIYIKQIDEDLYYKSLTFLKRQEEIGHLTIIKALKMKRLNQKITYFNIAKDIYASLKNKFYEKAMIRQMQLIDEQKLLAKATGDISLVCSSISGTLFQLIYGDEHAMVKKFAKRMKVKDALLWCITIKAKESKGDFIGIENLLKLKKKPPSGFKPFINVFVKHNYYRLAEELILKETKDPFYQFSMLERIKSYTKAAEVAIKNKLYDLLPELVENSKDREVEVFVNNAMALLNKK